MQTVDQLVLDENNIAFHPMMGNSYQLNEIGKKIINLLKIHKTKEEIIQELIQEYDIDENELFIDLSDFLRKMRIYGLLA
jgi:hypothetical protein